MFMKRVCFLGIAICLMSTLTVSPASAAEFGYGGLDVHAGVNLPSDWDTGVIFGVSANVAELVPGLYLYPGIFYSTAEDSDTFLNGSIDLDITSLAVGAEVRYFLTRELSGFYFGGGAYLNRIEIEATARVGFVTGVADDETDSVGAMAVAGYRFPLGENFDGAVEARYNAVSDFDGPSVLFVLGF